MDGEEVPLLLELSGNMRWADSSFHSNMVKSFFAWMVGDGWMDIL